MKTKNQYKAMYLIFCLMMCIPSIQYAKTTKNTRTPGTAIFVMATVEETPSVSDKNFNVQKYGLNLDMHIPQFNNLSDKVFEKQLNTRLIKEAIARKKEIINLAKSYNQDMIQDGLEPVPFEYIETFSVIPSIQPFYVVELYKYQYSGGAHGISELNYINLNLEENKMVTLADLFKENVDYIPLINESVRQEINRREQLGEFFFTGSDGFQTIKTNQPFLINKNGELVIVFNVYEIAPYASGAIYITIPLSHIRPYLK